MTDIQHYRHTIATVDESNRLQDLISELQNLPPEQKAEVISAVIGAKESGLSVIFGNGNNTILQPDVVVQINSASSDVVKSLTDAIAKCIYPS